MIRDCVVASDGTVSIDRMGGNAVYAAVGARHWCNSVGVVACVPQNYPAAWLDALENAGISCAGVERHPERVAEPEWFFYAPDGSRLDHVHAPPGILQDLGLLGDRLTSVEVECLRAAVLAWPKNELDFSTLR